MKRVCILILFTALLLTVCLIPVSVQAFLSDDEIVSELIISKDSVEVGETIGWSITDNCDFPYTELNVGGELKNETNGTSEYLEFHEKSGTITIYEPGTYRLHFFVIHEDSYYGVQDFSTPAVYITVTATQKYTVTLDPNGGSVSPASVIVYYGAPYGSLPMPARTGYTFTGWWTAKDTGGKQVTASTVCHASGNYTLYARWKPKTITVTLNANGGSVNPASITATYGQAYGTLPTPARTGYNFLGWWTAASGGKQVTASTVCYATGNYTVYARWTTAKSYTVTLNPVGGSVSPTTKTVYSGSAYGTLPTPTRTGYTFTGWWTTQSSGGKQVTASTVCNATGNYTLYARWIPKAYIVILDPAGGSVNPSFKAVAYGIAYGSMPTPTRTGYAFSGWWTAQTSGGKQVTASTICYATGNYTLYARWTKLKTYTVTLNPSGGSVSPATKTVYYGTAYGTMPTPTRTGYAFDGWWTTQSSGGKQVTASTVCYASGNYTLYARWIPKSYTVVLNPNGGSVSPATKAVTYGTAYGTLPTPTRTGYTFAGWWTTQSTGGKRVYSSTICYATNNYTLYARWTKN